ncbi:MAG TPA: Crp/Fnr family transcriptional regulator [Chitinophagaceae bacterium]|nr:Crp/Fnr family transcriptional regulator [Chitinophagaceae bacterium]
MIQTLLNNINVFVTLSPEEETIVGSFFRSKMFRKRQYILQEGQKARYKTFIVKGITRTYEVDETGQEHIFQFGLENWWVGDLYSFLTDTDSNYNIDCLEDTEVLQITRPDLEIAFERVPKMERYFRINVENTFVATTKRVSSTLAKSAMERYDEFLKRFPQIEQRVPNHQIASYLGITPQSLSRIRSQAATRSR